MLYLLYEYQKRRLELRAKLKHEHKETERLLELDHIKTRLYTNITHEFRTPLTIILGMVEQIKTNLKDWHHEGLQMIKRSGTMLLRLVNQMLDLAKLEAGNMSIDMVQGDVVNYLQYIIESFHAYC